MYAYPFYRNWEKRAIEFSSGRFLGHFLGRSQDTRRLYCVVVSPLATHFAKQLPYKEKGHDDKKRMDDRFGAGGLARVAGGRATGGSGGRGCTAG
jgi:hypothetical protein